MHNPMPKYVSVGKKMPTRRSVESRMDVFKELYDRVLEVQMRRQASRCEQCGVPFCQAYYPASNNIPDRLKATVEERMRETYELS